MPQVRFAMHTSTGEGHVPVHVWFPVEPYFFAPIFVTVLGLLVLRFGRLHAGPARRLLMAATAWSGVSFALIVLWELSGGG